MNTFNEVEVRIPKAVLIADTLAVLPEFEVMRALFSTLDIRWLVVATQQGKAAGLRSKDTQFEGSDLFAIPAEATPDDIRRRLLSVTRTVPSRRPPAKPIHTHFDPSAPRDVLNSAFGTSTRQNQPTSPPQTQPAATDRSSMMPHAMPVILIGASTGGVDALLSVLDHFPADCPPTMIVQHTGSGFGESLAALLDRQCRAEVALAVGPGVLRPGLVVVGAGHRAHLVMQDHRTLRYRLDGTDPVSGHVPSVDMLFNSATGMAARVSAALLTGMGRDGAAGLKALRDSGARTFAQDQATSTVYGMPRAAAEIEAAEKVLPLQDVGPALLQSAAKLSRTGRAIQ